jgi:hypothetical protein
MGIVYLPMSVEVRYRCAKRCQQEGAKPTPFLYNLWENQNFVGEEKEAVSLPPEIPTFPR